VSQAEEFFEKFRYYFSGGNGDSFGARIWLPLESGHSMYYRCRYFQRELRQSKEYGIIACDYYNEEAYLLTIHAYLAQKTYGNAMKLYRHVKELFQEELGVPFVCEELENMTEK